VKKTLMVVLVVVFVLALAAPAFAIGSMNHSGEIKADAEIVKWDKIAGHKCNTGARAEKVVRGVGEMNNVFSLTMVKGKLTVVDNHAFVSRAGTTNPIFVQTRIDLCTPPKYTYTGWQFGLDLPGKTNVDKGFAVTAPVSPKAMYLPGEDSPRYWMGDEWAGTNVVDRAASGNWTALSQQTWYARVEADAGALGVLNQSFDAAYGPFTGTAYSSAELVRPVGSWAWSSVTGNPIAGVAFVGDYFKMTQEAMTPSGKVDRYIDISSPWSGSYLFEDMEMVGLVDVMESFNLINIAAGVDTPRLPWRTAGLVTKR
jgi:hypothetical protein